MESVFLSYHFDDEVKPLAKQLSRLTKSHDLEVVDGERLAGQDITQAVQELIESTDAMIVLLTKRDEGKTNQWVMHERSTALNKHIPFIALIEEGVVDKGPFTNFEYIQFTRDKFLEALLRISETILKWKVKLGERIVAHLEPDEIVEAVRSNIGNADMVQYRFFDNRRGWGNWKKALVKPQSGGVSLYLDGVNKDTEMQIQVTTNGRVWQSDVINRNLRILVTAP